MNLNFTFMVFNVTYCLEIHNAIIFYSSSDVFDQTKMSMFYYVQTNVGLVSFLFDTIWVIIMRISHF